MGLVENQNRCFKFYLIFESFNVKKKILCYYTYENVNVASQACDELSLD